MLNPTFYINKKSKAQKQYVDRKNAIIYNDVLNFNNKIGTTILQYKDIIDFDFVNNVKDTKFYDIGEPTRFGENKRTRKTYYKKYSVN